jgi:hypothetical protein
MKINPFYYGEVVTGEIFPIESMKLNGSRMSFVADITFF